MGAWELGGIEFKFGGVVLDSKFKSSYAGFSGLGYVRLEVPWISGGVGISGSGGPQDVLLLLTFMAMLDKNSQAKKLF